MVCEYCLQLQHASRCPNFEPKVLFSCDECGEKILEGEYMWMGNSGFALCSEECFDIFHGKREILADEYEVYYS